MMPPIPHRMYITTTCLTCGTWRVMVHDEGGAVLYVALDRSLHAATRDAQEALSQIHRGRLRLMAATN